MMTTICDHHKVRGLNYPFWDRFRSDFLYARYIAFREEEGSGWLCLPLLQVAVRMASCMINNYATYSREETPIGVLGDTELLLVERYQGKRVLRSLLLSWEQDAPQSLFEQLWQTELAEVWVLPGTSLSRRVTCSWLEQTSPQWIALSHPVPGEPDRPACAFLLPKASARRQGRQLALVFPEHAGWDWKLDDATALLATVTYLREVLGRSLHDAPTLVARQILTDLVGDQASPLARSPTIDLSILKSSDGAQVLQREQSDDLIWMRPLTFREERQRYLHKYSHVSRSLEACMSVQLGTGTPQHYMDGRGYDGLHAGLWRIKGERLGSVFDGKQLPCGLAYEWMSTPQVRCCQEMGYQVQVQEGYLWPQSQPLLRQWAATLWQAAERLHTQRVIYRHAQARANAIHSVRFLAEQGMALLVQDREAGGWARPDLWVQIVGQRRAYLFAHLVRLVRRGVMPVLINQNAFWVVSNDPNPLTAVPGLLSGPRWRGYSTGYAVPLPLSSQIRTALRSGQPPARVIEMLDTLAGQTSP
jgi:hypothetical protein